MPTLHITHAVASVTRLAHTQSLQRAAAAVFHACMQMMHGQVCLQMMQAGCTMATMQPCP